MVFHARRHQIQHWSTTSTSGSRTRNVRDVPDKHYCIVRCTTGAFNEAFGPTEQLAVRLAVMHIPELFFRHEWLKVDVLYVLAMRTMDRDRCCLKHFQLAILQYY
jgi:hypothetical protein